MRKKSEQIDGSKLALGNIQFEEIGLKKVAAIRDLAILVPGQGAQQ